MLLTHAGKYFNLTTATSSGRCSLRERESVCAYRSVCVTEWEGIAWGDIRTYPSTHAGACVHLVLVALFALSLSLSPSFTISSLCPYLFASKGDWLSSSSLCLHSCFYNTPHKSSLQEDIEVAFSATYRETLFVCVCLLCCHLCKYSIFKLKMNFQAERDTQSHSAE